LRLDAFVDSASKLETKPSFSSSFFIKFVATSEKNLNERVINTLTLQ
jgi:hypothetical protein